jgi:transglutaminase-like putative cysteine protease
VTSLRISHRTTYRYNRPVHLNPHRLMLRPRESRELRLVSMNVSITPKAKVVWARDVSDNWVATVEFSADTTQLEIESTAAIELNATAWPIFPVATSALNFPFNYDDDEWTDLGALATPLHADSGGRLRDWAQAFVRGNPTDTLSLLKDINAGISTWVAYQAREDEGTQSPLETLDRCLGSCRDFAVLFVGAVRSLGFGARIVSGYLHMTSPTTLGSAEGGSTHAWAEVYVPGAGWITFDPTNHSVGGANLIPVAVGRDIAHVMPVSGSFVGASDAYLGMTVEVRVAPT